MSFDPERHLRLGRSHAARRQCGGGRARRRSLALVLPALLIMVFAATPARAEEKSGVTMTFSCTSVTFTFTGFPNATNNTVTEVVTADGMHISKTTFSFNGPSGSNMVTISLAPGHHRMDAHAKWHTNGVRGARDQPLVGGITCPPPEFSIEKLQEIAGAGGGFTTSPVTGEVGQTVNYEIVVTNTGGIALRFSHLTDPHCDKGTISGGPGEGSVATGKSTTYSCAHVLTFADLIASSYTNTATDTGKPECPCTVITKTSNTVVVAVRGKYAALGDSFSSGEGAAQRFALKNYYAKTNEPEEEVFKENEKEQELIPSTNQCHRSRLAYPGVVARTLYGEASTAEEEVMKQQPPKFIFRACSGAVMENLFPGPGQWNEPILEPAGLLPKPAQVNWLTLPGGVVVGKAVPNEGIRLVTLGIGGNDAGFATILRACIDSDSEVVNAKQGYSPAKCKAVINEWKTGEGEAKGKGIPSIKEKLPEVLTTVREYAPNAVIRVVLYPRILDIRQVGNVPVGKTSICVIGETNFWIDKVLAKNDNVAGELIVFEGALNRTIQETTEKWAAERKEARVKAVRTWTAFAGHELGDFAPESSELWVNALLFLPKSEEGICPTPKPSVESFHPNARGHSAIAREVLASLR
jgi:lysophospholipase L1-like esterase